MLVIATSILAIFWLRDYMSLGMSPSQNTVRRSMAYGVAVVLTATVIWKIVMRIGVLDFAQWLKSPWALTLLIAVHIAGILPSLWIRQKENYRWMWATALVPAPVAWLLLLQAMLFLAHTSEVEAVRLGFFSIAILWAASMIVITFRTRYTPMPLETLDFAVLFGGLSHGIALCVFPVALLLT